jgi:hypothetical protein
MGKQNCWELKKCGRESGGSKSSELGVCAATNNTRANGIHGGKNGGRVCWAIAGTLCGGKIQGTHAAKQGSCMICDFYKQVVREEGATVKSTPQILAVLK